MLESLIALAIVTMAVTLLTQAHMQTLRAERMSRMLEGARLQMETVVSGIMLGVDRSVLAEEAREAGWLVGSKLTGGGNGLAAWESWTVAASNAPSAAVVVYLKPRGVK